MELFALEVVADNAYDTHALGDGAGGGAEEGHEKHQTDAVESACVPAGWGAHVLESFVAVLEDGCAGRDAGFARPGVGLADMDSCGNVGSGGHLFEL